MVHDELPGNLELLPALAALLDERHVSRAAERVRVSQPAMSRTLVRLRRIFSDELLVRDSAGYVLTPRAERMQRQLLALGPQLRALFAAADFDPATAAETFRLTGTDYAALVVLPLVTASLLRRSPSSQLQFSSWHDQAFDDAERGSTDLVFYGLAPPDGLRSEALFEERFVCVLDAAHPLARSEQLDLDAYLGCSHLVVDLERGAQTIIDRQLSALGARRFVPLRVPYHMAAARSLPGTELVATLPERLTYELDPSLRVCAAPAEVESMVYRMAWHPRLEGDPAQRWLRDIIREAVAAEEPTGPRHPAR